MLKSLNLTATKDSHAKPPSASLFAQYGLDNIERCSPDKTMYKMTFSERLSLYVAIWIAVFGSLLALIVSSMRKSYEKNLRLLQCSKYQFMTQYATMQQNKFQATNSIRPMHHMSMGTLQSQTNNSNGNANFVASLYGFQPDYQAGGPVYDTWQLWE